MAVRPTDPEALHLFQLIGAPLLAVVQAEAQAAQVSAHFIKEIGFTKPVPQLPGAPDLPPAAVAPVDGPPGPTGEPSAPRPEPPPAGLLPSEAQAPPKPPSESTPLQAGGDIGDLRIAEFRIDRLAADGTVQPWRVRVPVLSLFPIPLLQVKHADFEFDIRVLSRVPLEDVSEVDDKRDRALSAQVPCDFLAKQRVELKGFLATSHGGRGGEAINDASIKVRVRMEQSDVPTGLTRLMSIMGENVTAVPMTLIEQPRPSRKDEKTEGPAGQ